MSLKNRVPEVRIEVQLVAVASPILANVNHVCPARIADKAPNRAPSEKQRLRDVPNGAIGMKSYVEQHDTMAGEHVPLALAAFFQVSTVSTKCHDPGEGGGMTAPNCLTLFEPPRLSASRHTQPAGQPMKPRP